MTIVQDISHWKQLFLWLRETTKVETALLRHSDERNFQQSQEYLRQLGETGSSLTMSLLGNIVAIVTLIRFAWIDPMPLTAKIVCTLSLSVFALLASGRLWRLFSKGY